MPQLKRLALSLHQPLFPVGWKIYLPLVWLGADLSQNVAARLDGNGSQCLLPVCCDVGTKPLYVVRSEMLGAEGIETLGQIVLC